MRGKDQPDIRPIETLVPFFAVCGPKYTLWCQNCKGDIEVYSAVFRLTISCFSVQTFAIRLAIKL